MTPTLKLLVAVLTATAVCGAAHAAAGDHPSVNRALAHLRNRGTDADAYALRDVIVDADGSAHVRFDRSYKGLRVIGGDVVVHANARGELRDYSETLRGAVRTDTRARFDDAEAIQYAQSIYTGQADGRPSAQLVIYARGAEPQLAYDVTFRGENAEGTPSVLHMIIDASSLQRLDQYDEVMTASSAGIGDTLLSGAVTITTDS